MCYTKHRICFTVSKHHQSVCVCVPVVLASVVGPALTFRIRQNEHNMTAAEVAAKAGEVQKHTLTDTPTPTYPRK